MSIHKLNIFKASSIRTPMLGRPERAETNLIHFNP